MGLDGPDSKAGTAVERNVVSFVMSGWTQWGKPPRSVTRTSGISADIRSRNLTNTTIIIIIDRACCGAMVQAGRSRDRVPMRLLDCFPCIESFQQHHGPGVYSASYKKRVPEDIYGCKERPARKADNLAVVLSRL
jgi:hypothetical protein